MQGAACVGQTTHAQALASWTPRVETQVHQPAVRLEGLPVHTALPLRCLRCGCWHGVAPTHEEGILDDHGVLQTRRPALSNVSRTQIWTQIQFSGREVTPKCAAVVEGQSYQGQVSRTSK